jgi:hypothetical protein
LGADGSCIHGSIGVGFTGLDAFGVFFYLPKMGVSRKLVASYGYCEIIPLALAIMCCFCGIRKEAVGYTNRPHSTLSVQLATTPFVADGIQTAWMKLKEAMRINFAVRLSRTLVSRQSRRNDRCLGISSSLPNLTYTLSYFCW